LGIMGDLPSNQALLDWLAVDFIEHGWDVKRLFRQMMCLALAGNWPGLDSPVANASASPRAEVPPSNEANAA
ncbi:MAG: DUF1553 domain-containing protein, partial [Verrucomicrobiota bacterium]